MNAFMTIQVRVISAQALAQMKQMQLASAKTAASMGAVNKTAQWGLSPLSRWGNQIQWVGRQLTYNFTIPIALAMGAATKFALENEKAMVRVAKVYGDATPKFRQLAKVEIPALREAFVALSNRFGVHQQQVISIAGDWAAAGASGLALAKSVKLTLETMVLGELEAAEATKQLIAIQAQYGFGVTQLAKTIDILNMVENQTGTTMKDLMDGMARAAGVARVAGVDVEHLAAMMAALTPAAGSAATAGNSLKTILSRILSPTKEANELLGAMGIAVDSVAWNSRSGAERLEILAKSFTTLSSAQKAQLATIMGSRWQLNRLIILLQAVENENSYYNKALRSTNDEQRIFTQRQRELQQVLESNPQKIQQTWVIIKNAMADVIIPLLPFIVAVAQGVANLAQKFADLDLMTQKWVLVGFVLLALLGPIARYVGALANMFGLLGSFVHWLAPAFAKLVLVMAAPFTGAVKVVGFGVTLMMGYFWKMFYTVKYVFPAMMGLMVATMQATLALFGITGAALATSWRMAWIAIVAITAQAARVIPLVFSKTAIAWVGIWKAIGIGIAAVWRTAMVALPLIAMAAVKSIAAVFIVGARVLMNPWVAAGLAILGVAYHFRDKIADAWGAITTWVVEQWAGVVGFFQDVADAIIDAFWRLPEGITSAFMAVLTFIRDVALQIYEWMSYLNPFATHSPSLVDSVTAGMDVIVNQYRRVAGIGSVFAKAARDLAAFKKAAAGRDEYSDDRKQVVKSGGNAGLFDALRSDLAQLQPLLAAQEAAVAAQERVVDRWAAALERADERIDRLQSGMDRLRERLDSLTEAYDRHEQRLQNFATAPIRGMGAMQDAIFKNEMAQKRLELQILQTGEASRKAVDQATAAYDREERTLDRLKAKLEEISSEIDRHKEALQEFANSPILGMREMSDAIFENEMAQKALRLEIMKLEDAYGGTNIKDISDQLSRLQGEIEQTQGVINDLRAAGAGSEILGPLQDQLAALVSQRNNLASGGQTGEDPQLTALRKQLEELQRAGEMLDLEQSLKFDPLTRQIDQLVNAQKELSFDTIVAGIKREQAAIDALTPAYDKASAAVERQEAVVKKAAAARDAAEAAYEKELQAIQKLEAKLEDLQNQGQILQLKYDIKFGPLIREIDQLVNKRKELTFDQIINGIKREQAAMAKLQPEINKVNAAIDRQEAAIKRATAARDQVQSRYDREQKQLQALQDEYQKTESLIRDIESALQDMGQVANEAIQKASAAKKSGASAAGSAAGEYVPNAVKNFEAAKSGNWPDVGSKQKIGREGGMGSQADLIRQFAEDQIAEMNEIFKNVDMLGPLKKAWGHVVNWLKENVGPALAPIGGAIRDVFTKAGDWVQRSGIGDKIGGAFAKIKEKTGSFFKLLAEDFRELWSGLNLDKGFDVPSWLKPSGGLKKAFSDFFNAVGPEVAKFKDLWEPLKNLWEQLKPGLEALAKIIGGTLLVAFKLFIDILSGVLPPLLTMVGDVLAGVIRSFRGFLEFIMGVFTLDWKLAWKGIKDIFGGQLDLIVGLVTGLWDTLKGLFWAIVDGIKEAWEWLKDELVGHSVIPDMIDAIFDVFGRLVRLGQWVWNNVLEPVKDFFVKLWKNVREELEGWWDGIKKAWSNIKSADWWKNEVLAPLGAAIAKWWENRKDDFESWWNAIKQAWSNIKSGDWWKNNVLIPLANAISTWWSNRVSDFKGWWDAIRTAWANIKDNVGDWWNRNVWNPVKNAIGTWWGERKQAWRGWWDDIKQAWSNIKSGEWWDNHVMKPIKNAMIDAWKGIKDWFRNNSDSVLNPIRNVVKGIVNAINFIIKGINKLSNLPGLEWINIKEIAVPFAKGGSLPSRRVGGGFRTTGARAIVGEGKANYPEYVIPTDPTYRSRAQSLLQQAAGKVGMLGIPMHADGGILGAISDKVGSVIDAGKAGWDWIKGNVAKLASQLAMPLINKAKDIVSEKVDWKYGRAAVNAAIDQVVKWLGIADKVFEKKASSFSAGPGGPPIQGGDWERVSWRGHTFNARTVRMIQAAERILGQQYHITQGSWSNYSASAGTHSGGGAFDATSPATMKARNAARQAGFAAWLRSPSDGPWPWHIHGIALGDIQASSAAKAQMLSYLAGGDGLAGAMGGVLNRGSIKMAEGGIVSSSTGGTLATIGEGGQDEAVIPLPRNWQFNPQGNQDRMDELIFLMEEVRWASIRSEQAMLRMSDRIQYDFIPAVKLIEGIIKAQAILSDTFRTNVIAKMDESKVMVETQHLEMTGILRDELLTFFRDEMLVWLKDDYFLWLKDEFFLWFKDEYFAWFKDEYFTWLKEEYFAEVRLQSELLINGFDMVNKSINLSANKIANTIGKAVNNLQKQIDKNDNQIDTLRSRVANLSDRVSSLAQSIPRMASGGVVRARVGGTLARLAEAGNDEAVIPLPKNWRNGTALKQGSGTDKTEINIYGNLEFPNINTGEDAEVLIANLKSLAGGAA